MTIGEHHPHKHMHGKLYRLCYRNKWLEVSGRKLDWRHYEGQELEEKRPAGKMCYDDHIMVVTNKDRRD